MIKALGRRGMRMLLTATALLAGAAGVALATIPGSDGVINGCFEKRTGLLRVIDIEAGKKCTIYETPISWNQKGEQGLQGIQGEKGDAGAQGEQGPPGPPGPAGADGKDGATGPPGPPGADGKDGAAGAQGPSGAEGPQGPAGAQGEPGAQGPAGPQGEQGPQGPAGPAGGKTPIFLQDERGGAIAIDFDALPVVCQTADHTPTVAAHALVHGWIAADSSTAGLMSYSVRLVFSTDAGATWINLDALFARAGRDAVDVWAYAAQIDRLNLTAGTTYRFGVRASRAAGVVDATESRCEVLVEIT